MKLPGRFLFCLWKLVCLFSSGNTCLGFVLSPVRLQGLIRAVHIYTRARIKREGMLQVREGCFGLNEDLFLSQCCFLRIQVIPCFKNIFRL